MIKSHESIIGTGRGHHTGLRHRDCNAFVTKFLRGLQKLPTIGRSGDRWLFVGLNSFVQKQFGLLHRKLCRNQCSSKSLNLTLKRVKSFKPSTSWIPNADRFGGLII